MVAAIAMIEIVSNIISKFKIYSAGFSSCLIVACVADCACTGVIELSSGCMVFFTSGAERSRNCSTNFVMTVCGSDIALTVPSSETVKPGTLCTFVSVT